uniref:hypothetical protein n=1 Tax=Prevotella sp. TaxID=59823 RepID=UPI004028460F
MKKEYIKPKIIIIKTCNDDALLQSASLCDIDKRDPVENIAGEGGEDGPITDGDGTIWND